MRRVIPILALMMLWSFSVAIASAAPHPWWDNGWPFRAYITCPAGDGDVGYVSLNLAGRAKDDARDLRLIDDDGDPVAFQILHHDPDWETLIAFQVLSEKEVTLWAYYGNENAKPIKTHNPNAKARQIAMDNWRHRKEKQREIEKRRQPLEAKLKQLESELESAERQNNDDKAQTCRQQIRQVEAQLDAIGPVPDNPRPDMAGAWRIQRGVLLRTYQKAQQGHPADLIQYRRLLKASTLEGADFRDGIADGFNPFGTSDHYLSVYEGYLTIEKDGVYEFCTASDDGSWLYVDNKPIVAWPGSHDASGGKRGEHNGQIRLKRGTVQVRYYHEEGIGGQVAFIGWKPPGAEAFSAIPKQCWLSVRQASITRYDSGEKPVFAVPQVEILHTYWAPESDKLQATMVRCTSRNVPERGTTAQYQWTFGDGTTADGREVKHAYFRLGRPEITLTVTDALGQSDSATVRPNIFQVDVVAAYFRYGTPQAYQTHASEYDVDRMAVEDLVGYARFWSHMDNSAVHAKAVKALIARFPNHPAGCELAVTAAAAMLEPSAYDPQTALQLLELAEKGADDRAARGELLYAKANLLAWHLHRLDNARTILQTLRKEIQSRRGRVFRVLRRKTQILSADISLLEAKYRDAEKQYREVRPIKRDEMAQAEEMVKTGGNAYIVEDLLERSEYRWALKALDQWEEELPVQKLEGLTFFLRGKVIYVQSPCELAIEYLELSETVAPKAIHVPEAIWLRANCLMDLGKYSSALEQFMRIRNDFTYSEFFERAADKIKACEKVISHDQK